MRPWAQWSKLLLVACTCLGLCEGAVKYRPADKKGSGELVKTDVGECTLENNSGGLIIVTVFVKTPDGAPVANELVHLNSRGGRVEDDHETDRYQRTSEDGCIQFAEATGKKTSVGKSSQCRIHTIDLPEQLSDEATFLGCYHNHALQVNKVIHQPGSVKGNDAARRALVSAPSGPGRVSVTCNLEDNSEADVVTATVAVKNQKDVPVSNELVLLEDRGEIAEDLYALTSPDGCVQFMESTGQGEGGCNIQTLRLPNQPELKATPLGCHRNGWLTATARVSKPSGSGSDEPPGGDPEPDSSPPPPPESGGLHMRLAMVGVGVALVGVLAVVARSWWKARPQNSRSESSDVTDPLVNQQEMQPAPRPIVPDAWHFEIDPQDMDRRGWQLLGRGSYGVVYKGVWRGTEVAIKHFEDHNLLDSVRRDFKREAQIMARLRHPNIVLFMAAIIQPNELAIVSEYHPRGNLFRLLHRSRAQIHPRRLLYMAMDVARGMTYLHSCRPPVVHRDLKSPNLLLDQYWTVKICDLGLSRVLSSTVSPTPQTSSGTPEWMAPEVLQCSDRIDEKCDVFSFGVVLWELVTRMEPWSGLDPLQVIAAVGLHRKRLPIPEDLDTDVAEMIRACWEEDPNLRPDFQSILKTLASFEHQGKYLQPSTSCMVAFAASAEIGT